MLNQFSRTALMFGREAMEKLGRARVAVFGLGGVGGYTVEALARSGIGALDLIDDDKICLTNLNRQILALHPTMDQYKTDAAERRVREICPEIVIHKHNCFYMPDTADAFDFTQYDYIVDAIDTVTGKLELVRRAQLAGTPIISSMGAGNKVDPTAFRVADIYATKICPLAKVMRSELRRMGIPTLKVVYSEEPPIKPLEEMSESCPPGTARKCTVRREIPGSNAFVPPVAGLILAGEVIKDLAGFRAEGRTKGRV